MKNRKEDSRDSDVSISRKTQHGMVTGDLCLSQFLSVPYLLLGSRTAADTAQNPGHPHDP